MKLKFLNVSLRETVHWLNEVWHRLRLCLQPTHWSSLFVKSGLTIKVSLGILECARKFPQCGHHVVWYHVFSSAVRVSSYHWEWCVSL